MAARGPAMAHPANSVREPAGAGTMYGRSCAEARNRSTSEVTAVAEVT
jgi:hypothetical protein